MIIYRLTTYFSLLILFFAIGIELTLGNNSTRVSREEYIHRYGEIAIAHQQRYRIPASITMAQGILESDCGNSRLAKASNNHFGIKCKGGWNGRSVRHTDDAPNECFRAYDTVEESYRDHAEFLDSSPRYDSLFRFEPTDYRSWARALKGAGYATAPDYTERLVKIIEDSKLYELDRLAQNPQYHSTAGFTPRPVVERATQSEGVDPNNFRIAANSSSGYSLYTTNSSTYVVAKSGDSYSSIAKGLGLSATSLRRFNDCADGREELAKGDVVFVEKKSRRWGGNLREHMVLEGESLHSISQAYGLRQRSLQRLNRLGEGEEPQVGQTLRLQ